MKRRLTIGIVGSRGIHDPMVVEQALAATFDRWRKECWPDTHDPRGIVIERIVSGGATGVDVMARELGIHHGITVQEFTPNYELFPGKRAPVIRNEAIVAVSDWVVAIWDGRSPGTKRVIDLCVDMGVRYSVHRI